VRRGEVYWAELAAALRRRAVGATAVIIVSHDASTRCDVALGHRRPRLDVDTQARRGPTAVPLARGWVGLRAPSVALCIQVTTLDRAKLSERLGVLPAGPSSSCRMGCAPRSISTRYNPAMDDAAIEHTLRVFFRPGARGLRRPLFGSVARAPPYGKRPWTSPSCSRGHRPTGLDGLPLDLEGSSERLLACPSSGRPQSTPGGPDNRVLRDASCSSTAPCASRSNSARAQRVFDLKPVLDQYRAIRPRSVTDESSSPRSSPSSRRVSSSCADSPGAAR